MSCKIQDGVPLKWKKETLANFFPPLDRQSLERKNVYRKFFISQFFKKLIIVAATNPLTGWPRGPMLTAHTSPLPPHTWGPGSVNQHSSHVGGQPASAHNWPVLYIYSYLSPNKASTLWTAVRSCTCSYRYLYGVGWYGRPCTCTATLWNFCESKSCVNPNPAAGRRHLSNNLRTEAALKEPNTLFTLKDKSFKRDKNSDTENNGKTKIS